MWLTGNVKKLEYTCNVTLVIVAVLLCVDIALRIQSGVGTHHCGAGLKPAPADVPVVSTVLEIGEEWIDDPSLVPFDTSELSCERIRVVGDFNGDGIDDMALSDSLLIAVNERNRQLKTLN